MANIPLKTLTLSGLDNVYTVVDPEEVAKKANQDGNYDDLSAGSANQLISNNYIEDKIPYLYRRSGGDGADRAIDTIVGGTVVWNQLLYDLSNIQKTGGTTSVSDGIATFTANAQNQQAFLYLTFSSLPTHVYLAKAIYKTSTPTSLVQLRAFAVNAVAIETTDWQTVWLVYKASGSNNYSVGIQDTRSSGFDAIQIKVLQVFDLTKMFGSTIADYIYSLETASAGSGIAKLKSWGFFTKDYYAYNAGELMSVGGLQSHDTVGFNQWDEEAEAGYWDIPSGQKISGGTWKRCKNYISALPNTSYFFKFTVPSLGSFGAVIFLDNEKNIISYITNSAQIVNEQFTTPDRTAYIVFYANQNWFNFDICINLSDPDKNGTYESYKKISYPLDSTLTLRGIPKLDADNNLYYDGDEYASDGSVKRKYALIDPSNSSTYTNVVYGVSSNGTPYVDLKASNLKQNNVGFSNVYTWKTTSTTKESGVFCIYGTEITVYDSNFTSASQAIELLTANNVVFIVESATPTSETADPYTNPQVVSSEGTEEYVTTSIVPVGHITKYPENLRAKVDGLPWDLSMIAPIDNGTTATRAYSTGQYFMHNNQFCKAKTSIASGATFTLNTNYEVTTVAAELYAALH